VDTRPKFLDHIRVATLAFIPRDFARRLNAMRLTMATGTGFFPQHRPVNALLDGSCRVGVARPGVHARDALGVGVLLDIGVAIVAGKNSVNAGLLLRPIHLDTVAGLVLHLLFPVTCQAIGVRGRWCNQRRPQR
jgi:hypothetical protein